MRALWSELRQAGRTLRRNPGYAVVATATLALGLGATTAIFAVVDSVVLDPLRYPDSEELVWIDSPVPGYDADAAWDLSVAGYFHFRDENRTFESLGAFVPRDATVADDDDAGGRARRVDGAAVTSSLLETLGARPAHGRLLGPAEDGPDAPAVAVLGHDFWVRAYGADPGVVGSTIRIDAVPFEVIGVMAAGIHLPDQSVEVWVPLPIDPAAEPVSSHFLGAVGRLAPGVSADRAQRDLDRLTGQFTELFPGAYRESFMRRYGFSTRVTPLHDHVVGDVAGVLWTIFGAVGLVLMIACANVANLFLARMEGRRREIAIRAALGASRARLVRHGLAEGVVLGVLAGAIGAFLASYGLDALLAMAPVTAIPRLTEIGLDGGAITYAAIASLTAGAVVGLVVLLRTSPDLTALGDGARGLTDSRARHRTRRALVVGQVALALVLLASAGLMLRTLDRLRTVEPGFDPTGVLLADVSLPAVGYGGFEEIAAFHRELSERMRGVSGVDAFGAASSLPLEWSGACAGMFVENRAPRPDERPPCIEKAHATPGFFRALGVPLEGREPTWADQAGPAGGGVVVSRALAERMWPEGSALGGGIRGNNPGETYYRVAGVTPDLYAGGLDEPPMEVVYFPMLPIDGTSFWVPPREMTLAVRTASGDPTSIAPLIRDAVAAIDPRVPVTAVRTLDGVVDASMARRTFVMLLLAVAAGLGLVLSAVGLYGVIAYTVGRRTGEFGIRMALGAGARDVARPVLGEALALAGVGVVLGLAGAVAVTRLLRALLYGVSPTDPTTLVASAAALVVVALAASWIPVRRSTRVDPMVALREE
ncbi:MAG: ABC transporter permease [Gemmatimonadota bacterium]